MTKPYKGLVDDNGRVFWGKMNHTYGGSGSNELWYPDIATFKKRYFKNCLAAPYYRACRDDLPFDLTPEYVESIFPEDGLCPVLGRPMSLINEPNKHKKPSLDKHIPERGYVQGNVAWLSLEANRLKNNATLEELEQLVAYLRKINGNQ